MTHHTRTRPILRCNECGGRSFSDPSLPYHYPQCSKYAAWRFGARKRVRELAESLRVSGLCPHGFKNWTDCGGCTEAADFDDGGEA